MGHLLCSIGGKSSMSRRTGKREAAPEVANPLACFTSGLDVEFIRFLGEEGVSFPWPTSVSDSESA